jgi:copper chaperone CopZ
MKYKKFNISNLKNDDQITSIRNSISQIDGVKAVRVDTIANTITVEYDENKVSTNQLQSQINQLDNFS